MRVELRYADTPPSLNTQATSHWRRYHGSKRKWQGVFEGLLLGSKMPRPARNVYAEAILTFPTNRRRDEGNFRYMIEKALGDALVNGGWIADDTPEHYRMGRVVFQHVPNARETLVLLTVAP
jgi:hypothetical protein